MYAKTVEFLNGFLCNSFVEPETKEAFVFPNNDGSKTWIFWIHYRLKTTVFTRVLVDPVYKSTPNF